METDLDTVFDTNRVRSAAKWRDLLAALSNALGRLLERHVMHVQLRVEEDDLAVACHPGALDFRVLPAPMPLLEACGTIAVTVDAGERVGVSAHLLLFVEGSRVRGPRNADVFQLEFTKAEGWVPTGWRRDVHGEWESETALPSLDE
jgi:hypothetical protein